MLLEVYEKIRAENIFFVAVLGMEGPYCSIYNNAMRFSTVTKNLFHNYCLNCPQRKKQRQRMVLLYGGSNNSFSI